ncbi:MAG: redoxin domain-containing protein [Nitrospirae bacterium]|nr:redoxin domain-containing protein [Nitrospirota bacterium]MCL5236299.1 redoxin domain-containing protein [Nitrospirota bacterium]
MRRFRFCFTIFILLSVIFGNTAYTCAAAQGSPAPDFTLNDVNGKKVALSEFRGRVVLLNFWATWCGPCKAEMPSLNSLYLALKDKGLVVLAISVDTSEKPVKSFISEKKLALPVLMDKNKEIYFDSYAVVGLPTTFIIDKSGGIVEKIMGENVWDSPQMKEKILRLLGGKP